MNITIEKKNSLCFIHRQVEGKSQRQLLLGYKKRGLGMGFWNGFGGKIEEGEDLCTGALREVQEESSLVCSGELQPAGRLLFSFEKTKNELHKGAGGQKAFRKHMDLSSDLSQFFRSVLRFWAELGMKGSLEESDLSGFASQLDSLSGLELKLTEAFIFNIYSYIGRPQESSEMRPSWFNYSEIPYTKMWPDDVYWLPLLLRRIPFLGYFHFDSFEHLRQGHLYSTSKNDLPYL